MYPAPPVTKMLFAMSDDARREKREVKDWIFGEELGMEITGNKIEFIMLDEKLIEEKLPLLEQRKRRSCNSTATTVRSIFFFFFSFLVGDFIKGENETEKCLKLGRERERERLDRWRSVDVSFRIEIQFCFYNFIWVFLKYVFNIIFYR